MLDYHSLSNQSITIYPSLFRIFPNWNLKVTQRTNAIELHFLDLEVDGIKLVNDYNGFVFEPENTEVNKECGTLKLLFKNPVNVGPYRLHMRFEGFINGIPDGLFYTKCYKPGEYEENIYVFTNFHPNSARRCFPCWDQPSFKATFDLSLTIPGNYKALSNMPVERIEKFGRLKKYYFEKTPPICTYLVAFAIGEFGQIESVSNCGKPVELFTMEGLEEQGEFALDVAVKAIKFFSDYFKTPFPLPKLDLVAIPNYKPDISENWGLILFRDINLLLNPFSSTDLTKRWIALIVSHQVAHQWLGNLVSIEWWNQIWLQEACTHLVENICVDYFFPQYEIWNLFSLEFQQTAFELDESNDAHPVDRIIKNRTLFDDLYDGLSFNKGSSLMKMIHHYVGDESFRNGILRYFSVHIYQNASPRDFFGALEETSSKPIGSIMSTWSQQSGYPVVRVFITPGCDCRQNRRGITIKLVQNKFVRNQAKGKPENEAALWKIPITLITSSNQTEEMQFLLDNREMKLFIPNVAAESWIKVNPGSIGYFRVQYSPELLKRFVTPIRNMTLSAIDRIGILDDLFHMIKYGYTNVADLLQLMTAFEEEKEFLVRSNVCRILNKLSILISKTNFEEDFKKFKSKLLAKLSSTLDTSKKLEECKLQHLARKMALGQMTWLDDEKLIVEDKKTLEEEQSTDLNISCYQSVIKTGENKEFETLMKLYKTVDTYEERKSILNALCGDKSQNSLRKLLTFALSNETCPESTVFVVMTISSTETGKDLLWNYYRTHWRDILDKGTNNGYFKRMLEAITAKNVNETSPIVIQNFFDERLPCNEVKFRAALETLKNNTLWLERNSEAMKQFFSSLEH